MMRIITGSAKGVRLETLEGDNTRPTSERIKEAVFSAIQFEVEGCRVLDLFAGSGQMGLEALSRGAESCMFVDSSPEAIAIVKKNIEKTKFTERCRYLISDYRNYIRKAANEKEFDLIFIDPPYADNSVGDALERIVKAKLASCGCIIVCESGNEDIFDTRAELYSLFELKKKARYSKSYITILTYKGE